MVSIVAILSFFVFSTIAHAETYWVSPNGSATLCSQIDGEPDPGSYMTPSTIASNGCAAAGDTVVYKSGTYTGPIVRPDQVIPSGISPTQRSRLICEGNQTCEIAYNTESHTHGGIFTFWNRRNLIIGERGHGFDINAANAPNEPGGIRFHLSSSANPQIYSDILFEGNKIRNMGGNGIGAHRYSNDHMYTRVVIRHNTIGPWASTTQVPDAPHGIYATGEDWIIEHNTIHTMATPSGTYATYAIQGWHYSNNIIVRFNELIVNHPNARGITNGNSKTNTPTNALIHNNVITCPANNCTALAISFANPADNTSAYNNTVSGFTTFLSVTTSNVGSVFKNNVCTNGSCNITIASPATIDCGGTCTTTNPTVTASTHFTDAANGDFSLKSGSSLINAGVDVGLPFNGSAPDRGAFESIPQPTASITANVLTLTFAESYVPIQNLSTTGVTVTCTPNGDSCPTPTVASITRRNGTDSIVDVTISGITSDACSSGQNWSISYTPGTWSNTMNIGGVRNQLAFSFSNLAATNGCTGSGPPSLPAGLYISYDFDEGTGTTLTNTGSFGASGNGTLNGGSWANGGGVTLAQQSSTDYVSVPYGSGLNPTTQDLTIAFTVDVVPGNESLQLGYFGSQLGTNQRFHVLTSGGTWRIAVGSFSGNAASEFNVSSGPVNICVTVNATTDVVTLHVDGVASTQAGGMQSISSYTLASNFELGRIANIATGGGGTYKHFRIYNSVEDCADIYAATLGGGGGTPTGTFSQVAVRAQDVFLDAESNVVNQRAINTATRAAVNGASAWLFQVNCDNCGDTAFRLAYRKNGAGSWLQVPATETSDGIYMWGTSAPAYFNNGTPGAEISGTCTEQTGATITTTSQTPTIPFPSSGCVVLRYVVRIGTNATPGDFFNLRLETQAGGALDTYDNLARIDVIGRQMTH